MEIIEQIGGEFGVTVRYRYNEGDAHVDFFAAEILAVDEANAPLYWRKGADDSMDNTAVLDDAERYFDGSVKWDGCSHITFGDEGYLHLCGRAKFDKLAEALPTIYKRCGQIMKEAGQNLLEGEFNSDDSAPNELTLGTAG